MFWVASALAGMGFLVQSYTIEALRTPKPELVQRAVKFSIMALVWLHVGLVLGVRGVLPALVVALFWVPAAYHRALDLLDLTARSRCHNSR